MRPQASGIGTGAAPGITGGTWSCGPALPSGSWRSRAVERGTLDTTSQVFGIGAPHGYRMKPSPWLVLGVASVVVKADGAFCCQRWIKLFGQQGPTLMRVALPGRYLKAGQRPV